MDERRDKIVGRRLIDRQLEFFKLRILPDKSALLPKKRRTRCLKILDVHARQLQQLLSILQNQRDDTTAVTGSDNRHQPLGRHFSEVDWEIGHHQHPIRLSHLARRLIVLLDRFELVAEVFWMTFSMCCVMSDSRWSIWADSVQMRLVTNDSS